MTEIKGISANKGVVSGKATIICDMSEKEKFVPGSVLVTNVANAEIGKLIKDAAAVVANQGSLLSHIATISREYEKPCVVGTENGTELINDDDELEVNADEGIVKILD